MLRITILAILALSSTALAAQPKWKLKKLALGAPGNRMTEIKVNPDGRLHLVFTGCSDERCANSELFYGERSVDGNWQLTSVDSEGKDTGWFPSMSLDDQGQIHVFYADHDQQRLHYAVRAANGTWSTQKVSDVRGGWWTSSAWNNGTLYFAHTLLPKTGWDNAFLEVGTMTNGVWSLQTVDKIKNAGWFTSMAITPAGMPVVTYNRVFSQPVGNLELAEKTASGWEITDIDSGVVKNHLAIDSKGFIHVVYDKTLETENVRRLMYTTNAPDGEWKKEVLDDGEGGKYSAGEFARIAIDAKDGLHIVYRYNSLDLKYARRMTPASAWEFSNIDALNGGVYPWIVTDAKGQVHITYERVGGIYYGVCADCALH